MASSRQSREIRGIFFDCDDTLCLSEQPAREACKGLHKEILAHFHDPKERESASQVFCSASGKSLRSILQLLSTRHPHALSPDDVETYVEREVELVTHRLEISCEPCPGVFNALKWARGEGYMIAVVSSSAKRRVLAALRSSGLEQFFSPENIFSAADSVSMPSSKPDPAIYRFACQELGMHTNECVAVEDSMAGAMAATGAGIPLIGYIGARQIQVDESGAELLALELEKYCGAREVMTHWDEFRSLVSKCGTGMKDHHEVEVSI